MSRWPCSTRPWVDRGLARHRSAAGGIGPALVTSLCRPPPPTALLPRATREGVGGVDLFVPRPEAVSGRSLGVGLRSHLAQEEKGTLRTASRHRTSLPSVLDEASGKIVRSAGHTRSRCKEGRAKIACSTANSFRSNLRDKVQYMYDHFFNGQSTRRPNRVRERLALSGLVAADGKYFAVTSHKN